VTRHNFAQTLPLVKEALAECKFYAFDCEMTGLFVKNNSGNNTGKAPAFLDDIEDRYDEVSFLYKFSRHRLSFSLLY
jgi:poly(A)-specific ribonuclease